MQTSRPIPLLSYRAGAEGHSVRVLPEEVAIALSFNGTTHAVMMATPDDLTDFAYGFALTEGIATPSDIASIEIVGVEHGLDVQIWLGKDAAGRLAKRRRTMAGPVGCGLCGLDSLEEAMRKLVPVPRSSFSMTPNDICAAISALPAAQPLHDATRAVHAAGFYTDHLVAAREDVGRHNALDKLAGHLVRTKFGPGAVVLTSRVSIDMVQKVAALGLPMLIAVSAPTTLAVTTADAAGITLVAMARPDSFEVFTHTDRITKDKADVA